jgi:hypothetical protein
MLCQLHKLLIYVVLRNQLVINFFFIIETFICLFAWGYHGRGLMSVVMNQDQRLVSTERIKSNKPWNIINHSLGVQYYWNLEVPNRPKGSEQLVFLRKLKKIS